MFRTLSVFATITLFLTPFAYGVPVQFSGNGHYYERIAPVNGITWTDARTAAAAMSFQGISGHLGTFTSAAEMQFGFDLSTNVYTWIGLTDEVNEGQFQWVTGEPFVFSAWLAGEPNNQASGPGEDYVTLDFRNVVGGWNDYQNLAGVIGGSAFGYLVEFDTVPEPSTIALLGMGAFVVGNSRRRKARPR